MGGLIGDKCCGFSKIPWLSFVIGSTRVALAASVPLVENSFCWEEERKDGTFT
jgi:hypothetical protein